MLEDIGDVDTKSTFLPWQNMAARKMEAGFQFESAIAERELAVWCGELHRNQDLDPSHWPRPMILCINAQAASSGDLAQGFG